MTMRHGLPTILTIRIVILIISVVLGLHTVAIASSEVLEELREHFDSSSIYHTGPEVLTDALAGKPSQIALLGRYFKNGERGFPIDESIAQRLYQTAYQRGHWSSAYELAKAAEAAGDYKAAYRYYVVLLVSAFEYQQINARVIRGWLPPGDPDFSHMAYAKIQFLGWVGKVARDDFATLETEAKNEAISRGFTLDCKGRAKKACLSVIDLEERIDCQHPIEERCYRDRSR